MFRSGNAYVYFSTIARNTLNSAVGNDGGMFVQNYLHGIGNVFHDNDSNDLVLSFPGAPFLGSNNIVGGSIPGQAPTGTVDCDPKLGPLANWGGPTSTLPLLAGSCAINAGPIDPLPNGISTDQRGLARGVNNTADIGAFEKQGDNDPDLIFDGGFDTSG